MRRERARDWGPSLQLPLGPLSHDRVGDGPFREQVRRFLPSLYGLQLADPIF